MPTSRKRERAAVSKKLLIIGGVSLDTLHLSHIEQPVQSPGGAGLYTALAARSAGGRVQLFAPLPDPLPDPLAPVGAVLDWNGPVIPPEQLPRLEIAHYGEGRAELLHAFWGAQFELSPDDLPADLSAFETAHIAALGPTENQLRMARACRARGVRRISAGTYGRAVYEEGDAVRALLAEVDLFFMNENEAAGLFGSVDDAWAAPAKVVFITLGAAGALCVTSQGTTRVPAPKVSEVDPTGAGDSFCGAVLARLRVGDDLESAMSAGCRIAAEMIQGIGPERLLD